MRIAATTTRKYKVNLVEFAQPGSQIAALPFVSVANCLFHFFAADITADSAGKFSVVIVAMFAHPILPGLDITSHNEFVSFVFLSYLTKDNKKNQQMFQVMLQQFRLYEQIAIQKSVNTASKQPGKRFYLFLFGLCTHCAALHFGLVECMKEVLLTGHFLIQQRI
mmetsp:Transcript_115734/g.172965  ORF Transcript_115734/g.172965 Transcript_115734/m.172965 type:complete len:165 (-) Transcript_115734:189-683(-)